MEKSATIFTNYRKKDEKLEISLALAKKLGIPVHTKQYKSYDQKKLVTKYVSINNSKLKVYYFVKIRNRNGKTVSEIQQLGGKLMGIKE